MSIGDAMIEVDPRYLRPLEVEFLQGDASKAGRKLGWKPKIRFKEIARIMVDSDMKDLEGMRRCQDVIKKLANNRTVRG